jgi:hypothetical protein
VAQDGLELLSRTCRAPVGSLLIVPGNGGSSRTLARQMLMRGGSRRVGEELLTVGPELSRPIPIRKGEPMVGPTKVLDVVWPFVGVANEQMPCYGALDLERGLVGDRAIPMTST